MFTKRTWVQLSLVLAALVIFGPRSLAQTISCSSDDGHRHYCPANTRGRVRLAQQRSESSCREGYSWGSDERGIWVDHGCRGILSSRRARVGIGTETVIKIETATEIGLETMTEIGIETAMQIETSTAGDQTKIRSSPMRRTTCTGITVRRIREVACNC
jgi:hypothetical protein